jgi:hypothetical protein
VFCVTDVAIPAALNGDVYSATGEDDMERLHLSVGGAIVLAVLVGACDDGPTRSPNVPSPSTAPNVPVATTRLEISGPGTVAPGESAQFSTTAYQSDGSTRNVTDEAEWRSGNLWALSISATGVATGVDRGEAPVGASFAGKTAWKSAVLVLPTGTYRLIGKVTDADLPVPGARVEVTAGTGRGLLTLSNSVGYRLYGVAGDIDVRVTINGYQEQRKSINVTSNQTLDFDLVLSRPREEIAGTYTLTVSAAAECRERLPEEARTRTYTAVVTQQGPRVSVSLEGSRFVVSGGQTFNSFRGTVEPAGITFRLNQYGEFSFYIYLPDVLEQLTSETLLSFSGTTVPTVTRSGLSGALSGTIETLQGASSGRFQQIAACTSTSHQFILSR